MCSSDLRYGIVQVAVEGRIEVGAAVIVFTLHPHDHYFLVVVSKKRYHRIQYILVGLVLVDDAVPQLKRLWVAGAFYPNIEKPHTGIQLLSNARVLAFSEVHLISWREQVVRSARLVGSWNGQLREVSIVMKSAHPIFEIHALGRSTRRPNAVVVAVDEHQRTVVLND